MNVLLNTMHWQWLRLQVFCASMFGLRSVALARLHEMLAMRPEDDYVLLTLAHYLGQRADGRAEAIVLLQRVLGHQPANAALHFNIGYLQEQLGQLDLAETSLRNALQHNDKLDRAWYGLGLVLVQQQRLDEAARAFKRNTEIQPMSPYGWYQLARVHFDCNEPEKTAKIIRHLQDFEPRIADQLRRETGLGRA